MITKTKYFKRGVPRRNIILYVIGGILAIAVVVFLIFTNVKISEKRKALEAQRDALEKEIQILEEKNRQLKDEASKQQTESFLEAEAREKLGFKKPGEEVVVVLPSEEQKEGVEVATSSFWERFKTSVSDFFQNFLEKLGL